jgi:colanic acid/amylovoran biosynthesis glycosyltransferase
MAAGRQADDVTQALEIAVACRQRGIGHLHAHFGTLATTVARLAAAIAGIGYSFTAHAKDIYHDYGHDTGLARKLRDADAVVTVSDFNLAHLRATYGGDAAASRRIFNGLDLGGLDWRAPDPAGRRDPGRGPAGREEGLPHPDRGHGDPGRTRPAPALPDHRTGRGGGQPARPDRGRGTGRHRHAGGPAPLSEVFAAMRRAAVWPAPASSAATATATACPPC